MSLLEAVAKANARGPTSGFTDVDDDQVQLPEGFDRISAKLFKPLKVGAFNLSHRVVHAALGRARSLELREPLLAAEYFAQRATPGGLFISQATGVTPGYLIGPFQVGLHRQDQIDALAKVIDAVHQGGGIWFQQLFHSGRACSPALVKLGYEMEGIPEPEYGYLPVSASSIGESGLNTHSGEPFGIPHALTIPEIQKVVQDFKDAAVNAVKAGADGIEVLAANGFLLDQFLHDNINQRNDIYGGSVENRSRLALEVVDAVAQVVGYQRIGVRLSPFSNFHETDGSNPLEQALHLFKALARRGVAFITVGEARVSRNLGMQENLERIAAKGIKPEDISLKPFRELIREIEPETTSFNRTVLFGNGGYTSATALITVQDELADAVVFGRRYISNPDIVRRIRYGYPFTPYDRSTFYTHGARGYITYKEYDGPISHEEIHDSPWIPKGQLSAQTKIIDNGHGHANGYINGDSNGVETNGSPDAKHSEPRADTKENGNHSAKAHLKKVAIIGAGISGIETASAFNRVGGFDIKIFERKGVPGGSWAYDPVSTTVPVFPGSTPDIVDPSVEKPSGPFPNTLPRNQQQRFTSSPLYENLYANIPYNIMSGGSSFPLPAPDNAEDGLFLPGNVVSSTVTKHARKYDSIITYNTTVENVDKDDAGILTLLLRRENDDETDTWYTETFDHLVVASGHNSVPKVPDIPGLNTWKGELRHTTTWRNGKDYANKRVIVVGTSESAIDVALQSLPHVQQPLYISQRTVHPRYPTVFIRTGITVVPTIESISESTINLSDGTKLTEIDTIVFATGYFYTYPFLSERIRPKTDGDRVPGLYLHTFDTYNLQSIAFIGVNNGSLSWMTWAKTAFVVALYWAGKIDLPPIEEQREWEAKRLAEKKNPRWFHILHPNSERVLFWSAFNGLASKYLELDVEADDTLLGAFPYEWMALLAPGSITSVVKLKHYGIES